MRLFYCLIMAFVVSTTLAIDLLQIPACLSGSLMSCAGIGAGLIMPIINIHSWSDGAAQPMFGTTCRSGLKGRLSGFQWKWDARFSCDNYPFVGQSTRQGKSSAIEAAFVDWMNQATNAGLFSSESQIGKK
ncbi:unnamed protein product [Rotaria sp. Silwood1]|nr:unnamed protein product [Rotaria sp. Silwood1]